MNSDRKVLASVMHDSDSRIGIDSGITPIFAGIGIGIMHLSPGIGIRVSEISDTGKRSNISSDDFLIYWWNPNRNRNQRMLAGIGIRDFLLESESEILKILELELEPESRHARNRASLTSISKLNTLIYKSLKRKSLSSTLFIKRKWRFKMLFTVFEGAVL